MGFLKEIFRGIKSEIGLSFPKREKLVVPKGERAFYFGKTVCRGFIRFTKIMFKLVFGIICWLWTSIGKTGARYYEHQNKMKQKTSNSDNKKYKLRKYKKPKQKKSNVEPVYSSETNFFFK